MHHYRNLSVWRKAHELTLRVYRVTERLDRGYASVVAQLRRAAHSIPANIAEGSGRATAAQFANFLQVSVASARELDYFLLLASGLGLLSSKDHAILEARTDEVTRMLVALRKTVVARTAKSATRRSRTTRGLAATE